MKERYIRNDMAQTINILVMDGDPLIHECLVNALTHEDYQVLAVKDGTSVLECIATWAFDLAMIAVGAGGTGNLEVLAKLRRQSPDTAIIALTPRPSLETAIEALRLGAQDYVLKPCRTVELRHSVRTALLRRKQEQRQRETLDQLKHYLRNSTEVPTLSEPGRQQTRFLQFGALIADPTRHVVTFEGHLLELNPTEADLLAYMMSEAPNVVSTQELIDEIQAYRNESWEVQDTVRYHIHRIREEIKETTGRTDVICTVPGAGYTIGELR